VLYVWATGADSLDLNFLAVVLRDGETVLVSTFGCRLLRVDGLDDEAPSVTLVHTFQGEGCALPVVAGDHWIQTVPAAHGLVALDVSSPGGPGRWPASHWATTTGPTGSPFRPTAGESS
jgi:hypothetical protein